MRKKVKPKMNDVIAHFAPEISKEIKEYATDKVLKSSQYIFTHRKGKKQFGYCTHCKNEFLVTGSNHFANTRYLKHNSDIQCPSCNSLCGVKASGYKRSDLIDEAYFVYYSKSVKNPKTIVARGIFALRDYTGDYHNVETKYMDKALYVFEMGCSYMASFHGYYHSDRKKFVPYGAGDMCKKVYSLCNQWHNVSDKVIKMCSHESIKKAVENTPFQYSTYECFLNDNYRSYEDFVKFFDLYSKYPCVEYLNKLGYTNLVRDKIDGKHTYGTINWKGKNPLTVLGLTKVEFNDIRKYNVKVSYLFLDILKKSKKDGSNFTVSEVQRLLSVYRDYDLDTLKQLLQYDSMRKITRYFNGQYMNNREHFRTETAALSTYRDYLSDCKKLIMNLSDSRILFPKDLYAAHQETIRLIKEQKHKKLEIELKVLDDKIKKRLKSLQKYCFEYNGLMIKPAVSTGELIAEGDALDICVGSYNNGYMISYAEGRTNLLLIRKKGELNKPFFIMEMYNDVIRQVRGFDNCNPDELVDDFVKHFKEKKLRMQKDKVSIPA